MNTAYRKILKQYMNRGPAMDALTRIAKPSRYRAHGTRDADGTFFHSKGELRRWQELQMLQTAGEIQELQRQVRFGLYVEASGYPGVNVVVGHFTPDFYYVETASGEVVIEDFKSPASAADEAYRLRKKLFEALYPFTVRETMRTRR